MFVHALRNKLVLIFGCGISRHLDGKIMHQAHRIREDLMRDFLTAIGKSHIRNLQAIASNPYACFRILSQ